MKDKKNKKKLAEIVETDTTNIAKEMSNTIEKMIADRKEKTKAAKFRLISQLEIMQQKYLTANGVMNALETVRVVDNTLYIHDEMMIAKSMAIALSKTVNKLTEKARGLRPEEMNRLCDDLYDANFAEGDGNEKDLIHQLLLLQLCQNIGPNAEDIKNFYDQATEEINKTKEDLASYKKEHNLD